MPFLGNNVDAIFIPESVNTSTTLRINGGDLHLDDGKKALFGQGDDLQIYHTGGTESVIKENAEGPLKILTNKLSIKNSGDAVVYAEFKSGTTGVELYYNNVKAFETTSTGIDVPLGTITGPATLTLDPAAVGDNTGTVVIKGDLQVDGTTTTINSTTLTVDDKNIVLASGAADSAAADGAGITVDGAAASLLYSSTTDAWSFNKNVGIGTESPASLLEVVTTSPTITTRATGNNSAKLALDGNRAADVIGGQIIGRWNGNDIARIDLRNGLDGTNKDDGEIAFATSANNSTPSERVRIDSSGNVGIGTINPDHKLDVRGEVQFIGTAGNTMLGISDNTSYIRNVNDGTDNAGNSILQMGGGDGSYVIAVQDGRGRVNHSWNATVGSSEEFLVDGENAFWLEMSPDTDGELFKLRKADGSGASAGDAISWTPVFGVDTDGLKYWGGYQGNYNSFQIIPSDPTSTTQDPTILRITSSEASTGTSPGDAYGAIEFAVYGAEINDDQPAAQTVTNDVIAAIKAIDWRNDATTNEDAGIGFYTTEAGVATPALTFRGGFSNDGGFYVGDNPKQGDFGGKLHVDYNTSESSIHYYAANIVVTNDSGVPDAFALTNRYDRDIGMVLRTGDSNGTSSTNRWYIWNDGANSGGNNNRFNISPDGTSSNGITILQNNNIGIGKGSPEEKLHVTGSIKLEAAAPFIKYAETGVTGNPVFWVGQDAGNFSVRLNNSAPHPFQIMTKGANSDAIDYVAIGGETEQARFKVTAATTQPTYVDLISNANNTRIRFYETTTERWNIGYDTGNNAFTFYDPQAAATRIKIYDGAAGGIVIGAEDNGGFTYPTTDGGGAATSPAALRIDGGAHAALFCYNDEQSADPVAIFAKGNEADDNQIVIIAGDGDGEEELLDIRSNTNPTVESDILSFARDNANSKFRVYGDGRVYTPYRIGVGTTDPSSQLDVIGNFEFRSPDANDTTNTKIIGQFDGAGTRNTYFRIGANENRRASIVFSGVNTSTDASTDYWSIGRGDSDELNASSFFIATGESGGNTAKLVIDLNGNVGIGTTNPLSLLMVGSPAANTSSYITFGKRIATSETNLPFIGQNDADGNGNNDLGLGACSSGGDVIIYAGNANPFTSNVERLRVAAGGNVGIGTTNPSQKLEINGNVAIGSTLINHHSTNDDDSLLPALKLEGVGYLLNREATTSNSSVLWGTIEPRPVGPSTKTWSEAGNVGNVGTFFTNVYGEADLSGITGDVEFTYAAAVAALEAVGARLPTVQEIMDEAGAGSGQGYDSFYLWTQTFASPNHVWVVHGRYDANEAKIVDITDPAEVYRVRGFFDVSKANMPVYFDNDEKIRTSEVKAQNNSLLLTGAGGTGITVDTSGNVSISESLEVNGLTVGAGSGGNAANSVFGTDAFASNVTGFGNVVMGKEAMYNNVGGNNNIALGTTAMFKTTSGSRNIAIGDDALYSLHSFPVSSNIAIGSSAMEGNVNTIASELENGTTYEISSNTDADFTTVGAPNNDIGTTFTATGPVSSGIGFARTRITGDSNVAVGSSALYGISTGRRNAAVGASAMIHVNTGENNVAIGYEAGRYRQNGSNMTSFDNCTHLGRNTRASGSNQVQLGDSSTTTYAYGSVQNRSDARDKTDVRDTLLGLNFIKSLRPVDFRWDYREKYFEKEEVTLEDGTVEEQLVAVAKDGSRAGKRFHHGLIAQEVKAAADAQGVDFAGYQDHSINGGDDVLSIGYAEMIAPLVKAVQELSAENAALKARLDDAGL